MSYPQHRRKQHTDMICSPLHVTPPCFPKDPNPPTMFLFVDFIIDTFNDQWQPDLRASPTQLWIHAPIENKNPAPVFGFLISYLRAGVRLQWQSPHLPSQPNALAGSATLGELTGEKQDFHRPSCPLITNQLYCLWFIFCEQRPC